MRVILLRGIPGSGKTTEAQRWKKLNPNAVVLSADSYMFAKHPEATGETPEEFNYRRLELCHEQCLADYHEALKGKAPLVIVDNTNTKYSDMTAYVVAADTLGYDFTVLQLHVDPKVAFERGTHQVPFETLVKCASRLWYERLPETWDVWNKGRPWQPPKKNRTGKAEAEVVSRRNP